MSLNLDTANETDIREEIATPLLAMLGYERGTNNNILREFQLSYNRNFLGTKKPEKDPPLRGKADYILAVIGAGRWALEIKAPNVEIDQDAIEQAITYARHPEVSATYAAILNGRRFVLFGNSQSSRDSPIIDIEVTSVVELEKRLRATLSPSAIRRDCSPPAVDLNLPLSDGLRSRADIIGGSLVSLECVAETNIPGFNLDDMKKILSGYRTAITGGHVWRDEQSRIRAKLEWAPPVAAMQQFILDKGLLEVEYVSLDNEISQDPANPTVFDVIGNVSVVEGEELYDLRQWQTVTAGISTFMTYRGQAFGYIQGNAFIGYYQAEYETTYPAAPGLKIDMYTLGEFEVKIDNR